MAYSLIANTGIHVISFPIEINIRGKFSLWFHEWYNTTEGEWTLNLLQELSDETNRYFYNKLDLFQSGYLSGAGLNEGIDAQTLHDDGIDPIAIDDETPKSGNLFKMSFSDRACTLASFENKWLPVPYFYLRNETRFKFGSLNWSRFKLVPKQGGGTGDIKRYDVLLAFDTRTKDDDDPYKECPTFPDQFTSELKFAVCRQEFQLMDYCSPNKDWEYINNYLFKLVHPTLSGVSRVTTGHKLGYIASYFLLIDYIAQNNIFPPITLYRDKDVVVKDIDLVVDIGNSKTTALLVEDNTNFNQVSQLQLVDYTALNNKEPKIVVHQEPFDMRIALRKADFGNFGIQGSMQFVYPSLVRLGAEATTLIHKATETDGNRERHSTLSSPKRYLWDWKKSKEEWRFITLDGEEDNHILNIPGISEQLLSDGKVLTDGIGGQSYHYSRRSMMTFAFLEMLCQAQTQINSDKYRTDRGEPEKPRRIRRIVVTCPTAMSKLEREALVRCASDAVKLLNKFTGTNQKVDIVPPAPSPRDTETRWYYDEATCAQLVYVYGEVGYKYKGCCQEFFNLYGRPNPQTGKSDLTIGSLDIGAGTSDLMISRYSYTTGDVTTILPDPIFYDSYYYAGDDMLNELIKGVMFFSPSSALRKQLQSMSDREYRQKLRDFFGPDYTGQTIADRRLRRDFNIQYSIPLMYKFLELLSNNSGDSVLRYSDVFGPDELNARVKDGFSRFFGFKVEDLEWKYEREYVSEAVRKAFEPLLKKIATIMYTYNCDIILLSGRPSSLAPIRNIFLKYYPVSPNRLILLNNYFVGHWYPFGNNTGYITNPKTIVAMGALIGYYATSLGNLNRFVIDKTKLDENLKSIVNYIESSREGLPVDYCITPEKSSGDLSLSSLPATLRIRQLGIDSYPSRDLYVIDFNENKISDRLRQNAAKNGVSVSDSMVLAQTKNIIDGLRMRMPFSLTISQDEENKEQLVISSITDRNGVEIADGNIEINIQSLGTNDRYWLDTGAFEIQ